MRRQRWETRGLKGHWTSSRRPLTQRKYSRNFQVRRGVYYVSFMLSCDHECIDLYVLIHVLVEMFVSASQASLVKVINSISLTLAAARAARCKVHSCKAAYTVHWYKVLGHR